MHASDSDPSSPHQQKQQKKQQSWQAANVTSLVSLETVTPKLVPAAKRVEVPPNITQACTPFFASDSHLQQSPTCESNLIFSFGSKADNPLVPLETVTPQVVPAAKRVEVPPIMPKNRRTQPFLPVKVSRQSPSHRCPQQMAPWSRLLQSLCLQRVKVTLPHLC